jgi:hypothetical protein
MSFDLKRLYELLPALYRIRDTEFGIRMLTGEEKAQLLALTGSENYFPDDRINGPLKSLLTIIAEQVAVLEENLEQLYDDQFIETCAEWAVSYIGELVGTRGLLNIPGSAFSQRGEVANTISYRRRKGTASVIEQLARDVTGWNASVVEYFQLLSTTQYMNHLRPGNLAFTGLRNWRLMEYANTPFDKTARTVDVRRIEKKRGKYNIPNIGIYLWRLNSYSLTKSPAYKMDDRRYTFNALGLNEPLYNLPVTEDDIAHLAEPVNVPMPISRMVLKNDLETYYGKDKSILVYANNSPVVPEEINILSSPPASLNDLITVCNLSDVYDSGGELTGWAHLPENKIAIDPVLGRLAFPTNLPPPETVHVSYYYGFSAEMGGGEYSRATTFTGDLQEIKVSSGNGTIQDALDQLALSGGIVEIQDNEYYFETPVIRIAEGKTIELRSADKCRPVLVLADEMLIEAGENSTVILNGLLISGSRLRLPLEDGNNNMNKLQLLRMVHCTLIPTGSPLIGEVAAQPAQPRIVIESPDTTVELDKCITGALRVFDGANVKISNSIVDALDENEVAFAGLSGHDAGGTLHTENSTFVGKVYTRIMVLASNCIFLAGMVPSLEWPSPVRAQRLQQGCARFTYFSPGSRVPHPYKCQPFSMAIASRVRPVFTSLIYGDPGYGQLSNHCAPEITRGADDEAEMGAFHDLYQPQRVSNLRTRLDEYLRFGMEAGIFYAS